MQADWTVFKNFVSSRSLSIQWIDLGTAYWLKAFDAQFDLECTLDKEVQLTEVEDFESNFKPNGNQTLSEPKDSDGSPLQRIKITTSGWAFQLHGVEFTTSNLSSIYSKKSDGSDIGFTTIKCYDEDNNLLTTQEDCDTLAIKTIVDWEPTYDYEIVGGFFKINAIPSEDVRLWVIGVPDVPIAYGGSKEFVSNINLKYIGLEEGIRADGRAPKYLEYSAVYHTNKMRLILTHPPGIKHNLHMILEIFKP